MGNGRWSERGAVARRYRAYKVRGVRHLARHAPTSRRKYRVRVFLGGILLLGDTTVSPTSTSSAPTRTNARRVPGTHVRGDLGRIRIGVADLKAFDCREDFPTLRATLEPRLDRLPPTSLACRAVLESRPLDLKHKLLALRLYETSFAASFSWWLVSLPFRFAVYGAALRPLRSVA